MRSVHRGVPQLVGIHLAQPLEALDRRVAAEPRERRVVDQAPVLHEDRLRAAAADSVAEAAAALGRHEMSRVDSQVPGPKGNREIFLWISGREAAPGV